jgi:malate dehydrogenase (oxaloacetate-decarboxylating)(NADP+)
MKIAASKALAKLAKEDVPDEVMSVYGATHLEFGPDYIIPKPFDPRVLIWEASAVAQAAIDTGVAEKQIDIGEYRDQLEARLGRGRELMRTIINKAQKAPKRIVFPEGTSERIIRASRQIINEKIAIPILLGDPDRIKEEAKRLRISLDGVEIIKPSSSPKREEYAKEIYEMRQRKGMTRTRASKRIRQENWFGPMMVRNGDADGMVSGVSQDYADILRPALKVLKTCEGVKHVAGMQIMAFKNKMKIFADIAVNIDPDAATLAEIALLTAQEARRLGVTPRMAMLSFSNFGSVRHPQYDKIMEAIDIIRKKDPDLLVEGGMHADVAVSTEILQKRYPFSVLESEANVLIFPDLMSANTAYKLLEQLGEATSIGPILLGMSKPVHVLQAFASTVQDIVNITAIAVLDAQSAKIC